MLNEEGKTSKLQRIENEYFKMFSQFAVSRRCRTEKQK